MTTDKKKAIFYLSIALIIGIFIGTLIPAFFGRMRHREWRDRKGTPDSKKEWVSRHERFTHMIVKLVQSDSVQAQQIKPFVEAAATKMDELEKGSNARMGSIMDSLKLQLKPILSDEQLKRLNDFTGRAHERWKRKD